LTKRFIRMGHRGVVKNLLGKKKKSRHPKRNEKKRSACPKQKKINEKEKNDKDLRTGSQHRSEKSKRKRVGKQKEAESRDGLGRTCMGKI